jgi:hypothetical protein
MFGILGDKVEQVVEQLPQNKGVEKDFWRSFQTNLRHRMGVEVDCGVISYKRGHHTWSTGAKQKVSWFQLHRQ